MAAQGALGANYNEHFEDVDYRDLEKADAEWLRIFLPMPQIDRDTAAGHGATRTLIEAKAKGYRTILSLKWPYPDRDFPRAGTSEYAREIARLDELLPLVMGRVDILVIGNEPYIESRARDRDLDLNRFYEAMARRVIDWRGDHCGAACPTRLYMGALNRLDLERNITESTERWLAFVRETPELEGVDIHPHLPSIEASQPFLDFVLPRLRPDQTFLATEFSLIHWWKRHMKAPVAPAFGERHDVPRNARNWQVIQAAIEEPFAKQLWDDFLRSSPWFESRKGYITNQMRRFRDTRRLAVATYGFKQGSSMEPPVRPQQDPLAAQQRVRAGHGARQSRRQRRAQLCVDRCIPRSAESRRRRMMVRTAFAALALCAAASPAAAQQATKPAVADDIFLDHPSMDRNATVMPDPDARPVEPIFSGRALGDASIARSDDGRWFLTGTTLRTGPRHGVSLWTSDNGRDWTAHGPAKISGHGVRVGDVSERYLAPSITIAGDTLYLAFADKTGCARIAAGKVAAPDGAFAAGPCLIEGASDVSLFVDGDTRYLLWGGGWIAKLAPDLSRLAEAPRFLKPDQALFAKSPPVGKDWPVRTHVGRSGATMFKHDGRYWLAASEVTSRLRTATDDLFLASAPTPYGPFSKRMLAVPHAGQSSIVALDDGRLAASYNPDCDDDFALFCEQVGLVPLAQAPDGRLRQAASILTEDSAVAARSPLVTSETMRDPSVTLGDDGYYYLVGTLNGYGYHRPEGGVKLWRSRDLESWEDRGFIWQWQDMGYDFGGRVAELWAPEIRWVEADQTYYLAFSVMERDVGGKTWLYRSTSGTAAGPYENVTDGFFVKGIDGFPFEDAGELYFLWGGGSIGKLNADRSGFEGEVRKLVDVDGDHVGYEGNGLIKVDGVYFLTGAEWHGPLRTHGTYDMMYATSPTLFGPYSQRRMGAPHGGHGTAFRDKEGRFWYTMFGNDPTASWRMHFGLVPINIGDPGSIGIPRIDAGGEAAE